MTRGKRVVLGVIILFGAYLIFPGIYKIINERQALRDSANSEATKKQIANLQMQIKECMAIAKDRVAELQAELKTCKSGAKSTSASKPKPIVGPAKKVFTRSRNASAVAVLEPTLPVAPVAPTSTPASADFGRFKTEANKLVALYKVAADNHRLYFFLEATLDPHYIVRPGVVPAQLAYEGLEKNWINITNQRKQVLSVARVLIAGSVASNGEKERAIGFIGKMNGWPEHTSFVRCMNSPMGAITMWKFREIQDSAKNADQEARTLNN